MRRTFAVSGSGRSLFMKGQKDYLLTLDFKDNAVELEKVCRGRNHSRNVQF